MRRAAGSGIRQALLEKFEFFLVMQGVGSEYNLRRVAPRTNRSALLNQPAVTRIGRAPRHRPPPRLHVLGGSGSTSRVPFPIGAPTPTDPRAPGLVKGHAFVQGGCSSPASVCSFGRKKVRLSHCQGTI